MRSLSTKRFLLILPMLVCAATVAMAGQVVSTAQNVRAVMEARGFRLVHLGASTSPVDYSTGDLAPQQMFELIRPRGERVTIGRLNTSCTCVQLETHKRTFEQGERAIFTLRNVIATPPAGQVYAIYVQLTHPIRTTLRVDTFVQSSQFIASPADDIEILEPGNVILTDDDVAEAKTGEDETGDATDTAESAAQDKTAKTDDESADKAGDAEADEQADAEDKTTKEPEEAAQDADAEDSPDAEKDAGEETAGEVETKAEAEADAEADADADAETAEPADTDAGDASENDDAVDSGEPADPAVESITM